MPVNRSRSNLKAFVSSTSKDLEDYRAVARLVILDMGWVPDMMEHFDAMPTPTVEACQEKLKECDLMVLIVAFRYGWVPTVEQGGNGQDSITALELDYARKHDIPVLAFLAEETWPGNLWDDDKTQVKKFRDNLNLPATFYAYEEPTVKESEPLPAFRTKLRSALLSYRERLLKEQAPTVSGASGAGLDQLRRAGAALCSGRCIPFIGQGIYTDGPLSTASLIKAFEKEADIKVSGEPCLATAAEFYNRFRLGRPDFLEGLEEIISEQAQKSTAPAVHELLIKIRPPLIVSTTEDLLLEEQLEAEGKKLLIFCHVIRSRNGEHDGKILKFEGLNDDKPDLYLADMIDLRDYVDAHVIYKPLGSPSLHRLVDPDLNIDTVVITEADHLVLLSRLENQSTGIPKAFSRRFQRYPLIFLGYPMDVWHYRLVVQVFQSIGAVSSESSSLAVRVPTPGMEEIAWNRLGVELLPMDPNAFAEKVCETL